MCMLSAPYLFLALQPSAKCLSKLGCTSYMAGPSQETNLPWGSSSVTLLLQIRCLQKVSLHPQLQEKNLKTKKWWWSSCWVYWGEWGHHKSTFDKWKNQSTGLCSGNEFGVKLRSSCSHRVQDTRTGWRPKRKASCTIHSFVNGLYQDHISWWPDTVQKCMSIYTLRNVKQIASRKKPHSTGRSAQCFVTT